MAEPDEPRKRIACNRTILQFAPMTMITTTQDYWQHERAGLLAARVCIGIDIDRFVHFNQSLAAQPLQPEGIHSLLRFGISLGGIASGSFAPSDLGFARMCCKPWYGDC